jgi:hypothetical protein
MPPTTWRKSSFSSEPDGDCVEVAFAPIAVAVRDSKNTGPTLTFDPHAWRDSLATITVQNSSPPTAAGAAASAL